MLQLDLKILSDSEFTGLSPIYGALLAEAATFCLAHNKHPNPVIMEIEGYFKERCQVTGIPIHSNASGSYADTQEATEYGAMGVAVYLICSETKMQVERSAKDGGGFDFWVGEKVDDYVFQKKDRLEVSGILNDTKTKAQYRLNQKLNQTQSSDNRDIPAYAIVVEFGGPLTLTGKRYEQ